MADGYDRKSALIAQLAAQRTDLSRHAHCVRESLDVGRRMKASFAEHRVAWLAGAVFAGVVLSRLRPRKSVKRAAANAPLQSAARAGFAWTMAKLLFALARPALVSMLTARITDFASGRMASRRGRPR